MYLSLEFVQPFTQFILLCMLKCEKVPTVIFFLLFLKPDEQFFLFYFLLFFT